MLFAAAFLLFAVTSPLARALSDNDELGNLTLSRSQLSYIYDVYAKGLQRATKNAKTPACKAQIEKELQRYLEPLLFEQSGPFDRTTFWSQCESVKKPGLMGQHFKSEGPPKPPPKHDIPQRSNETLVAKDLSILFVMLVHGNPDFVKRMIFALNESQHHFVIHVDKKSDETYESLKEFAIGVPNIYLLEYSKRVSGNWGGFTLVEATLNGLRFAHENKLKFDFAVDISGQSYPIKSNEFIKETLAVDPNAIYMDIRPDPNVPAPELWHHYTECDNAAHRITRLALRNLFIYGKPVVYYAPPCKWFLEDPLPLQFANYCKHIVVADEHYFTTMIKNSPYCGDHVNKNYNYLVFGEWESQLRTERVERDPKKCNQPDPDHCGRSPTTLTNQFERSVKASRALFARKFDPKNSTSMAFVDMVDAIRLIPPIDFSAEDEHSVFMIRLKNNETQSIQSSDSQQNPDICLRLAPKSGQRLIAVKCIPEDPTQWFSISQCIGSENAESSGNNTSMCGDRPADNADRFCFMQAAARAVHATGKVTSNVCVDVAGENPKPGGQLIGYDCTGGWNQHFKLRSDCSITAVQPKAVAIARGMKEPEELAVCFEVVENPAKPEEKVVNTAQCPGNGGANKKIFEFLKEMRGISWAVVNPAKRNITSTANANVDGNSDISADKKPAPDISKAAKDRNAPLDPSKDRAGAIRKEF